MSLLMPLQPAWTAYDVGHDHIEKQSADTPVAAPVLTGRFFISQSGWGLLSVPNGMVRGMFEAMQEPGIQLPTKDTDDPDSTFRAHISVMRKEDIEQIGGADKIKEKGEVFRYQLGPLKSVQPLTWDGVSRVWFVEVQSPELKALRKSYGLSPLPTKGDTEMQFHITVAIRKKGVLQNNDVKKAAGVHSYAPRSALDSIRMHGLLSGQALLQNPSALAAAAKGRDQDSTVFQKDIESHLSGWKPESAKGVNVMFASPPSGLDLHSNHPLKRRDLVPIEIDLDALMQDMPETQLHGQELMPYADYQAGGKDDVSLRHHNLSPEELTKLRGTSAEELWKHYNDAEGKGLYAPDVPHAAVVTPDGKIPSKYLKLPQQLADQVVIENKKGTTKDFGPDYPIPTMTYPVDYGSLPGHTGEDDADLDFFVGTGHDHGKFQVARKDARGGAETKFIINSTPEEHQSILDAFKPVLHGEHSPLTPDELSQHVAEFKNPDSWEKRPYRERAEMFALSPDHRIYGGIWDQDKSFAVPGGGVDDGEDVAAAAAREFMEEAGMRVKNPRLLPVDPVTYDWSPRHVATLPPEKQKYRGSRTHFVTADLDAAETPAGELDTWSATDKKFYPLADALAQMNGKTPMSPSAFEARKRVLQHLFEAAANKQASFAGDAWRTTPFTWQKGFGVFNNMLNHMRRLGDNTGRRIAERQEAENYYSGIDPQYRLQRAINTLHGHPSVPVSPLDRLLAGLPSSLPFLKTSATVAQLRKIKDHSDKKQYGRKHVMLRTLLQSEPEAWDVGEDAGMASVKHKATGFRYHLPKSVIPS